MPNIKDALTATGLTIATLFSSTSMTQAQHQPSAQSVETQNKTATLRNLQQGETLNNLLAESIRNKQHTNLRLPA